MADEEKAVEGQNTAPQGGDDTASSSPEAEQTASESEEVSQEDTARPAEESEEAPKEEEAPEKKEKEEPTRAERRINDLIGKLKSVEERAGEAGDVKKKDAAREAQDSLGRGQIPPWMQQQGQSIFEPGKEYTPEELENVITQRASQIAEQKVRQVLEGEKTREQQYNTLKTYTEDLESLKREAPELNEDSDSYDEEFDKALSKMIVDVNSNEQGAFVPKRTPREIYSSLKTAIDRARTDGQKNASAKMAESASKAAVPPSAGDVERSDDELEALRREAIDSGGSTEVWAEYLKRRGV